MREKKDRLWKKESTPFFACFLNLAMDLRTLRAERSWANKGERKEKSSWETVPLLLKKKKEKKLRKFRVATQLLYAVEIIHGQQLSWGRWRYAPLLSNWESYSQALQFSETVPCSSANFTVDSFLFSNRVLNRTNVVNRFSAPRYLQNVSKKPGQFYTKR